MRRLKRHDYFVHCTESELLLCAVKDGGPEFFAGGFCFRKLPDPTPDDLLNDICETLGLDLIDVAKRYHLTVGSPSKHMD